MGLPWPNETGVGRPLHNAAALLRGGEIESVYAKRLLPTYDVFDETRYFEPGSGPLVIAVAGTRLAVTVCEDIWNDKDFWLERKYHTDPVAECRDLGARAVLNLSASPFTLGKQAVREDMLRAITDHYGLPVLLANQTGGDDDLLFDGRSMAALPGRGLTARAMGFAEDVLLVDLDEGGGVAEDDFSPEAEAHNALVMGTRDFMTKQGFSTAVLGLSGGVDSTLTAAVAAEAIGPENVLGVLMPSPHTSQESLDDAADLAANLGMETLTLPIGGLMDGFGSALAEPFAGLQPGVTEENIQARIRGVLLMALSNKFGRFLLTTGNKSELAVGYCTIYGDMCGGLAVLGDVPKVLVYGVCRRMNALAGREVIPQNVLDKAPTAELRPDQKDQDSLPPYEELDPIVDGLTRGETPRQLAERGVDLELARRVETMMRRAEFKRRQAPPALKITDRAFGTGWRMPLAARLPEDES